MKKRLKKIGEIVVEKLLFLSGSITSITILLIVVFLFKEGFGLFSSPVVEDGYSLVVNTENRVGKLTVEDLTEIFDRKADNWAAFGGQDEPITVFYLDEIEEYATEEELGSDFENIPAVLDRIISENKGIIAFVPTEYLTEDHAGRAIDMGDISVGSFLGGTNWSPSSQPAPMYGLVPLLLGTLWVSLWAVVIALPFGLAVAIYMSELASRKIRNTLKPLVELLAGIPSVVYGFFGLVIVVPAIQKIFGLPVGETGFAGSVILAIMALPTIITVAEDAIRKTPNDMREASLAMGATQLQTIFRVVLPCSVSGITAAVVLGIGRAIGETMAVLMVTGNAAVIPHSLFEPMRTIPATIAAELGESPAGGVHYQALFMLGVVLFLITLVISVSVELINARNNKKNAI